MKNKDVALHWVKCMINNDLNHKIINGNHFFGIDNYLVSYSTPICHFINNEFVCSTKFYSKTTSKHMYYLNLALCYYRDNDPREIIIKPVDVIEGNIYR